MTSEEQKVNELKEFLLRQFRNGDKWVAFSPFANQLTKEDVVCFKTLEETAEHCESTFMAFKPLAGALRELNGESRQSLIDRNKLQEEIDKHPIESFIQGRDLVCDLARGELQPLIYNKKINPAFDIENYYLFEHKHSGHQVYEIDHEVYELEIFRSHDEALKKFYEQISINSRNADMLKPDLILVAALKNQKLLLDLEGMPIRNTGILLATAYPLYNMEHQRKLYEVNHWQPQQCPVLKQPMLAQFNLRSSKLNFYDGNLQIVQPGASIDFIKIDFYDFQPLKIGNMQKHSIGEDANLGHEEKPQHHSNKIRNNLN